MDGGPASGVDVFVRDSLHLAVQFEFDGAWGEDMQGGGRAVLDDHHLSHVLCDDSAETCEILENGAWVKVRVR